MWACQNLLLLETGLRRNDYFQVDFHLSLTSKNVTILYLFLGEKSNGVLVGPCLSLSYSNPTFTTNAFSSTEAIEVYPCLFCCPKQGNTFIYLNFFWSGKKVTFFMIILFSSSFNRCFQSVTLVRRWIQCSKIELGKILSRCLHFRKSQPKVNFMISRKIRLFLPGRHL